MITLKNQAVYSFAAFAAATPVAGGQDAPHGELSIESALVRAGATPALTWNISYPSSALEEVVAIENDDSVTTKKAVRLDVRLLGASYQPYGYDAVINFQIKVGRGSWETVFHGTDAAIDSSTAVFSTAVSAGTEVNFAAAGNIYGSYWTPSRNTLSQNLNVIALKGGDAVPAYTPAFSQGGIEDHVSAYIKDGKVVLGPRDVIYLIEIGQTNTSSRGFDMQDLVVVVTFDETAASSPSSLTTTETTQTTFSSADDDN